MSFPCGPRAMPDGLPPALVLARDASVAVEEEQPIAGWVGGDEDAVSRGVLGKPRRTDRTSIREQPLASRSSCRRRWQEGRSGAPPVCIGARGTREPDRDALRVCALARRLGARGRHVLPRRSGVSFAAELRFHPHAHGAREPCHHGPRVSGRLGPVRDRRRRLPEVLRIPEPSAIAYVLIVRSIIIVPITA